MRIAIVGAGFSGLTLAHALGGSAEVLVFDKARGVGGRMSTRRVDGRAFGGLQLGVPEFSGFEFDHGTQFFTAKTEAFRAYLEPLMAIGLVAEWTGPILAMERGRDPEDRPWLEPHYVAAPSMNSLCRALADQCNVVLNAEVAPVFLRHQNQWHLVDRGCNALGSFDWVISTAPPVQTANLFGPHLSHALPLPQVAMQGCYTLMLGFNKPWDRPWIAAKLRNSPLEWVGVNSSKPQRNAAVTSLVVHSRNDWAQQHIDEDLLETQAFLLKELHALTGIDGVAADYCTLHRWRYALVAEPQPVETYMDVTLGLASTGDWCSASRIEDVWHNALALAERLRAVL